MRGELGARRRRGRAAAAAAALVVAAVAVAAYLVVGRTSSGLRAVSQPFAPRPSRPVPGIGAVRYGLDSWRAASTYGAYSYLIVSLDLAARAAREPGRSLVYFAGTDVNTNWNTGVPYAQARRHGWLLKGRDGDLLVNQGYPANYVGDVGDPAYQRAWLANVTRLLRAYGDDGVFIDDVIPDLEPLAGTEAAKYPNARAWAAAELSFVRAVGNGLRARGFYVLVNASAFTRGSPESDDGTTTLRWWRRLAPYVSGLTNEFYEQTSDGRNTLRASGSAWNQAWDGWARLQETAQALGKDFVGLAYGPRGDARRMSYGRASFLLEWDGRGGAYIYQPTSGVDPWDGAWTTDIGLPKAPKRRLGNGWLRRYSRGVALVNPDGSKSQRFTLGGAYLAPDGRVVSEVTLPPTTGLILPAATVTDVAAAQAASSTGRNLTARLRSAAGDRTRPRQSKRRQPETRQ